MLWQSTERDLFSRIVSSSWLWPIVIKTGNHLKTIELLFSLLIIDMERHQASLWKDTCIMTRNRWPVYGGVISIHYAKVTYTGKTVVGMHWIQHFSHDDVIKWKHFPRSWSFVRGIHRYPINSPHKGQWRGALMCSLICVRINGLVNNGEAGDLRCYRAHYDVTVTLLVGFELIHWNRNPILVCWHFCCLVIVIIHFIINADIIHYSFHYQCNYQYHHHHNHNHHSYYIIISIIMYYHSHYHYNYFLIYMTFNSKNYISITKWWYLVWKRTDVLTHWGRVTHICVGNLTIIGSDNGLSPGRRQTITWTNVGILLIGPLGTNFSEMLIEIHTFSFKKIYSKMSSGKWRLFCRGLNVLNAVRFTPGILDSIVNNWNVSGCCTLAVFLATFLTFCVPWWKPMLCLVVLISCKIWWYDMKLPYTEVKLSSFINANYMWN